MNDAHMKQIEASPIFCLSSYKAAHVKLDEECHNTKIVVTKLLASAFVKGAKGDLPIELSFELMLNGFDPQLAVSGKFTDLPERESFFRLYTGVPLSEKIREFFVDLKQLTFEQRNSNHDDIQRRALKLLGFTS